MGFGAKIAVVSGFLVKPISFYALRIVSPLRAYGSKLDTPNIGWLIHVNTIKEQNLRLFGP